MYSINSVYQYTHVSKHNLHTNLRILMKNCGNNTNHHNTLHTRTGTQYYLQCGFKWGFSSIQHVLHTGKLQFQYKVCIKKQCFVKFTIRFVYP